jgi:hypothetical protein
MIDKLYKETQDILNKSQLGYLKPMSFNNYAYHSVLKVYNKLRSDLKTYTRKKNWMLDGKNYADYSEYTRQLLEHYTDIQELNKPFNLTGIEFVLNVTTTDGKVIDKVDYQELVDIKNSIYVSPTECTGKLAKVGDKLVIEPETIDTIKVFYLRAPKVPKWTYIEVNGKPMFNPTVSDFQDIDAPESLYDEILSNIVELASKELRELNITQLENQEQTQKDNLDNRQ